MVRDAFIDAGIPAVSCDLLPTESDRGPHIEGDVHPYLGGMGEFYDHRHPWDLVIAHPPCTYLANSGVRWLHTDPGRWAKLDAAASFFRACLSANARFVAVENPVMHCYGRDRIGGMRPCHSIQPCEFGYPWTKRTCFWTRGTLPKLEATDRVKPVGTYPEHNLPPGPERWKARSRTLLAVARAMAEQWGGLL